MALLLIDRVGRRVLLCVGTAGIVLALVYSGFIFYYLQPGELKGILLLIGILAFIFFFAIGPRRGDLDGHFRVAAAYAFEVPAWLWHYF